MKHIQTDYNIKSVVKAIEVIKCFNPETLRLRPVEVARVLGISKVTAFRIMKTLASNGFLEKDENTNKYTIGPILHFQGNLYLKTRDILKSAEPILNALRDLTEESLNLSFYDDGYITIIMKSVSISSPYRYDINIGTRRPAYASSMGKAFLSELKDKEIDGLYTDEELTPITPNTIPTKTELKLQLEQIRKTGVAISKGEGTEGIEGIASLIRDNFGKAIAAVSIHVPMYKANDGIVERYKSLIKMSTSLISHRLGYQFSNVHDMSEIYEWWNKNLFRLPDSKET